MPVGPTAGVSGPTLGTGDHPGPLRIETVTTTAELAALAPAWQALCSAAPLATPFESPAWLLPWWEQFGNDMPVASVAYAGSRLVGVLPLYRYEEGGPRKLLPIGVSLSDYFDAVLDPTYPDLAGPLLEACLDAAGPCDECHLPELRPGAALLRAPCPAGMVETRSADTVCPVLPLPPRWDRIAEVVPKKLLRNLRYVRQRAAAGGEVELIVAGRNDLRACLGELFRLHELRWQRRAGRGVCADPRVRAFHESAAPRLREAGWLRLIVLRVAGASLAAYYGLVSHGVAYSYLGGFDPDRPTLSGGTQALAHAIEDAIASGATEFHFLRGAEPYKYAWGARDRRNTARTFRPAP